MTVEFILHRPAVWGQHIALTGAIAELGNWNPLQSPVMQYLGDSCYRLKLDLSAQTSIEYKCCLIDALQQKIIAWEDGNNRQLHLSENEQFIELSDLKFQDFLPQKRRMAGVVIPLFSLRSEQSWGIGEFTDLIKLIDWATSAGVKIIQTLPINDTTQLHDKTDSYPYNAISIYALHPLYLHPEAIGELHNRSQRDCYLQRRQALNSLPTVDYEAVDSLKWEYFQEIFKQEGEQTLQSPEYADFWQKNQEWLAPYAEFCAKRDHANDEKLYCFLQFHADRQMTQARNYAHDKGVLLKGDIPIGISRQSVDAQLEPQYFNLQYQVGAPPDAFSANGQMWGFPSYNWQAMEADGFRWWKKRFRKMSDYFDAYRIDHILGFFRIWQMPADATTGLDGFFTPALPLTVTEIEQAGLPFTRDLWIEDTQQASHYHPYISFAQLPGYQALNDTEKAIYTRVHDDYFYHRHNEFWKQQALRRLTPLVQATDMLVCGEDLGMIPQSVPEVLAQLQILSLEIERMPKTSEQEFTDLSKIPYLSVCTTSTHDMTTLRGWWQEDREKTQRYFNTVLHQDGEAPSECTPELAALILRNHLQSPAMLVILPLQDWLSVDTDLRHPDSDSERINIPANSRHYWRYRMHLTIEDLLANENFNTKIRKIIEESQRDR
ncbi:MAG: 4-alpha-glucanotransferase [Candidatus Symbiothrix sp.]|nr:4-alpha-glucanotransferase [Candidatus Symbiothrix sp.]